MGADLKELSESNVLLERYPAQQAAGEDLSSFVEQAVETSGRKRTPTSTGAGRGAEDELVRDRQETAGSKAAPIAASATDVVR